MNKANGKRLVLELIKSDNTDDSSIRELLKQIIDYPWVLGQLLFNRMGGVAYLTLKRCGLLGNINREFRNSLKNSYEIQKIKAESFMQGLAVLADVFEGVTFPYAFLKGSFLIPRLYALGERTSNDYDIMVNQKDLDRIGELLADNGFVQGKCNFNKMEIKEATRFEILSSRMNRGETVPFHKRVDLPGMEILEVDINFSTDYKAKGIGDLVEKMLNNTEPLEVGDYKSLKTLGKEEFFIYLCCHLFKEATVYNWVKMQRDLSLYKFCDIYLFFFKYFKEPESIEKLIERIKEYGLNKECSFALVNTGKIYPSIENEDSFRRLLKEIQPEDMQFMTRVIYPEGQQLFTYDMEFTDWLFMHNRVELLQEMRGMGNEAQI